MTNSSPQLFYSQFATKFTFESVLDCNSFLFANGQLTSILDRDIAIWNSSC